MPSRAARGARATCYDEPPPRAGIQGAGTVHHIAWSRDDEHGAWRERVREAGAQPTPIIDRQYFQLIYFREPCGVLFELATPSPGFAIDEDPEHLGEELRCRRSTSICANGWNRRSRRWSTREQAHRHDRADRSRERSAQTGTAPAAP